MFTHYIYKEYTNKHFKEKRIMKKSYLMIAAAAALLAACSNNDTFKESVVEQAEQPLSFSAFADKVTKGTNSTALNDFYTVFGVYGWKTTATGVPSVFENVPNEYFTADGNGGTVYDGTDEKPSKEWNYVANSWYYENVRYWDKMATSYQFFAIAPYESTPTYSVNAGDANIAIATASQRYDISSEKNLAMTAATPAVPQENLIYSGFNKDYMIAEKKVVRPIATVTAADVQLVFHHILTKLNVNIKKASNYKGQQVLQVNKLHIINLAQKGNFVYNTDMVTNGWAKSDKYNIEIDTEYAIANASTNYDGYYWIETLIFPQTANCKKGGAQPTADGLSDLYLYIQYQIGDEVYNAYYDLAYVFDNTLAPTAATYYAAGDAEVVAGTKNVGEPKTFNEDGGDFEFKQGSQYNLTLTIGPEPIHFEAQVVEWTTETAAELTVN